MTKMGSLGRKLIVICIVAVAAACFSVVESYPQGSSDGVASSRDTEAQALIDACPCFDYKKMCASPPQATTAASPETQDDEKAEATTAGPEESPETTPVPVPSSSEATPAKDDEQVPTTSATATEDPGAPITTTTPKEKAPEGGPTTEKLDVSSEAPAPKSADGRAAKNLETAPADGNALDSLQKLLAELNEKLQKLEESQENLNKNIEMLEDKLKEYEKLIPAVQAQTTSALASNNPEEAVEQWKNLEAVIDDPEKLQNVTDDIVNMACEKHVAPQQTFNLVHNLPENVQNSAYSTLADNMGNSDQLQEQMYWKDMAPYCQAVAQDLGPDARTTQKMYDLQDQMRLNAAQPIKQCSQQINQQQYEPAVETWNSMTLDISDNPEQLKMNMEKLILKAYGGDPDSLPDIFQFVFVLPEEHGEYKDVAFETLRNEMDNNGHSFIYPPQNLQQLG